MLPTSESFKPQACLDEAGGEVLEHVLEVLVCQVLCLWVQLFSVHTDRLLTWDTNSDPSSLKLRGVWQLHLLLTKQSMLLFVRGSRGDLLHKGSGEAPQGKLGKHGSCEPFLFSLCCLIPMAGIVACWKELRTARNYATGEMGLSFRRPPIAVGAIQAHRRRRSHRQMHT